MAMLIMPEISSGRSAMMNPCKNQRAHVANTSKRDSKERSVTSRVV